MDKYIVLIIQKCIKVMLIHIRTLSDCHENYSFDIHLAILSNSILHHNYRLKDVLPDLCLCAEFEGSQ